MISFRKLLHDSQIPSSMDIVELNSNAQPELAPQPQQIVQLQKQLNSEPYDLVVSAGNPATDLFLNGALILPPQTPLLFCGYNNFHPGRPLPANTTGLMLPESNLPTFRLGMHLLPQTRKIAVICGGGATGASIENSILEKLKNFQDAEVMILSGNRYSTPEMLRQLEALPAESFVVFNNWSTRHNPRQESTENLLTMIRQHYPGPIFGTQDTVFSGGRGAGGVLTLGREHGAAAGEIAQKILAGTPCSELPVKAIQAQAVFHYPTMTEAGVSISDLPANVVLLDRPPTLWMRHEKALIAGVTLLLTLLLSSVLYLALSLRRSRRLNAIFNALPLNIVVVNRGGKLRFLRAFHLDYLKRCRHFTDLPAEIQAIYEKPLERIFATHAPETLEYSYQGRQRRGEVLYLSKKVFGEECVLWISGDIEELHKANLLHSSLANRLHLILNSIGDGVIATDENGTITQANPVAAHLTGYAQEEMNGRKLQSCFNLVDAANGQPRPIAPESLPGNPLETQINLIAKDGLPRRIAGNTAPILTPEGTSSGNVLIFRDITEDCAKRERLNKQNTLLQTAAELANMTYFTCDENGNLLTMPDNPGLWGLDASGNFLSYQDWVAPESQPLFQKNWLKLRNREIDSFLISYAAGTAKTGKRFYEMRLLRRSVPDSRKVEFFGIIRDTTEITTSEQQRHDILLLFETVMDNLPCYVYVKEVYNDYRFLICNNACCELFGKSFAEISGKNDRELFPDNPQVNTFHADDVHATEQTKAWETVSDFTDSTGAIHRGKFFRKIITRADGKKLLLGLVIDQTREIEREQRLSEAYEQLHIIIENLPCILWIKEIGPEHRYLVANQAYHQIMQQAPGTICGKTDIDLHPPELAKQYIDMDLAVLAAGRRQEYNETLETPDQGTRHIHTVKIPLSGGPQGHPLLLGMSFDVTELINSRNQQQLLNACLQAVLLNDNDDQATQQVLESVATWLRADMASVLRCNYSRKTLDPIWKWGTQQEKSKLATFRAFPYDEQEPWFQQLQQDQKLDIPDVEHCDQTQFNAHWVTYTMRMHLKSLYCIAIRHQNVHWGHLGLAYTGKPHTLSAQDLELLQAAAHVIEIIQERRSNREDATRSEREKLLIMDTIRIPIMLFDASTQLLRVNNAALQVAGVSEKEMYSQGCWKTFCGYKECPADCPVLLTCHDHSTHSRELRINGRDYFLQAYPIMLDGELINILETLVDVTDFNEVQRKLQVALQEAQSANKAKSSFLATMSHELRTPLNAVIGFSELLEGNSTPPAEQQEYIHSIHLAGNSLLNLINDVLDLSKIEADQMLIVPQPTDLKQLAAELCAIFQYKAREKHLELRLLCPSDLPILRIDSLRLRQILLNLIGNAVKFTNQGRVTIRIEFQSHWADKGHLQIQVSDTGIGIKQEFMEKIFQPFTQQDAIRDSGVFHGTGLGLTIAARLAQKMGGSIHVQSKENEGSTFTLDLPEVTNEAGSSQLPEHAAAVSTGQTTIHTVLLVDDVPMNLKVLDTMLKKLGLQTQCASSGAEALRLLASSMPDMILTDMWMPDMNGAELAAQVRGLPGGQEVKIIAVTADTETRNNFNLDQMQGILYKPVTMDKLRGLLAEN